MTSFKPNRTVPLLALALLWTLSLQAGEVMIYRDTWGVPHVYGDTGEAAAYGHGYAQAEDRLEDLLGAYLLAVGRAARVFGPRALDKDVVAHLARHERIARTRYPELSAETRRLVESFVEGVRAYMHDHPDAVPGWAEQPEPYHVVALYRAFAWAWPWGQARGDLKRAGSHVDDGRGSNQWVVGASRSAEGAPIALIDPHLSWEPQNRFYEAHVHGGDLDFYGFSIIGTPVMALGHTDVLSFALTTGGPDCADVYEERIHPDNPLQYEYDGAWRTVEVEEIEIEVKTPDGIKKEPLRIERTHHGPILERKGQRAWAVRTGYDNEIGLIEQWLGMARARNLGEFLNAMRANQALPQNLMYADVYGIIYYIRAGRVPVRPPGFEWDRPVPGWTSQTEWRGVHPLADLVQILNPPGGFMQNTNVSPGTIMPDSPLTADRYPDVIYNTRTGRSNSRGRRLLELLGSQRKLTLDDALRIAVDTRVDRADRWQTALEQAHEAQPERIPYQKLAVDLLLGWDGHMDVDSQAASLFHVWIRMCREDASGVPMDRIASGEPLGDDEQIALLQALDGAATVMRSRFGRLDVPWGETHRIRRGDGSWPVAGCRADGISTLRSVRFTSPDQYGVSYARGGQICTTVVLLKEDNVTSYSATPFGQSNDPSSAHYADQAERLFSQGQLKPTWFQKTDLLKHVEAKRTLTVPAAEAGSAASEEID
jgi:acyl-homoserine lactone acylase PvdQ